MKVFLQRILQEVMKKNNTWNIRHLVDNSFVPLSKWPSVLYSRLTDFKSAKLELYKRILIFHNPCYQCAAESQPTALASNTSLSSSIHTVSGGSDPHKRLCNAIAIAKKGYNPLCSKKRALIGEENTVGDTICKEGFASTNSTFMLIFCDPFLIYFRRCSQYIVHFNTLKLE